MSGSNIVSLSDGKDSAAMLLMFLERGEDDTRFAADEA